MEAPERRAVLTGMNVFSTPAAALAAAAAVLVAAAPAPAHAKPATAPAAPAADARAAAKKTCRQSSALFLRYGISNISVQRVSCRRAVRTLGRWSRAGQRGRGPSGWRCTRRDRVHFERVRCRRAAARFTFDLGGG